VASFRGLPRAVRALIIGAVVLAAAELLVWPAVDAVRGAIDDQRTQAAWPAQRAQIEWTLARVDLGARFVPVACPHDKGGGVRCWRYDGIPSDAVPRLEAALTAAAIPDVVADCDQATKAADGTALGCSARGAVGGRGLVLTAIRDVRPGATTRSELFEETSTVKLSANLTPP
jgi:hypothetical protein